MGGKYKVIESSKQRVVLGDPLGVSKPSQLTFEAGGPLHLSGRGEVGLEGGVLRLKTESGRNNIPDWHHLILELSGERFELSDSHHLADLIVMATAVAEVTGLQINDSSLKRSTLPATFEGKKTAYPEFFASVGGSEEDQLVVRTSFRFSRAFPMIVAGLVLAALGLGLVHIGEAAEIFVGEGSQLSGVGGRPQASPMGLSIIGYGLLVIGLLLPPGAVIQNLIREEFSLDSNGFSCKRGRKTGEKGCLDEILDLRLVHDDLQLVLRDRCVSVLPSLKSREEQCFLYRKVAEALDYHRKPAELKEE